MPLPDLQGLRVLVTRPGGQETGIMALLEQAGGRPIHFPTIDIQPLAAEPVTAPDLAIFISANAARYGLPLLHDRAATRFAAIGRATAGVLADAGVEVSIMPPSPYNTETFLNQSALQEVAGLDIVIVRGLGGRELLRRELEKRGARVSYLECYRRLRPERDASAELVSNDRALFDVSLCTSVEGLLNLKQMFQRQHENLLLSLPVIVVSDRMRDEALKAGYEKVVQAKNATPEATVEALEGVLKA